MSRNEPSWSLEPTGGERVRITSYDPSGYPGTPGAPLLWLTVGGSGAGLTVTEAREFLEDFSEAFAELTGDGRAALEAPMGRAGIVWMAQERRPAHAFVGGFGRSLCGTTTFARQTMEVSPDEAPCGPCLRAARARLAESEAPCEAAEGSLDPSRGAGGRPNESTSSAPTGGDS